METLPFHDTDEFYQALMARIKAGVPVLVTTEFTNLDDVPPKLKKLTELDKHQSPNWVNPITKAFILGASASVGLDVRYLMVVGGAAAGAAVGAAIGAFGGGIGAGPGALIGGVAGSLIGLTTAISLGGKHKVEIEIDAKSGMLRIKFTPI